MAPAGWGGRGGEQVSLEPGARNRWAAFWPPLPTDHGGKAKIST